MIIKNYRYVNNVISYTIDCDGMTLDVKHIKNSAGHVSVQDINDFLCDIAEFDQAESDRVEEFVDFQENCLLSGVLFGFDGGEQ